MHRWWVLLSCLLVTASLGCNKKRTEIVIGMATDLKVPTPLTSIDFRVYKIPGDFLLGQSTIPISSDVDIPYVLPATYAVYSESGSSDRFRVVLTATDNKGKTIVVRSAIMNLVPEKTLFVRLGTVSSCMGMLDCGQGQTCIDGICASDAVNSALLPAYVENLENEVSCAGGTTFLNTATNQPLTSTGASCPGGGACMEGVCLAPEPDQPAAITIDEFAVPTAGSQPEGIAKGPDGNIWFTEAVGNKIGRITPAGAFTEFPIPTAYANSEEIIAGPDGRLWYTQSGGRAIGAITTAGVITEYPLPDTTLGSLGMAAGSDGALWFTTTDYYAGVPKIGRMTTSGVVTTFDIPAPDGDGGTTLTGRPQSIAPGPDGALWFTFLNDNIFGRITTNGAVTLFPLPAFAAPPDGGVAQLNSIGIVPGPDRNLWFTQGTLVTDQSKDALTAGTGRILKANASGEVTTYPLPATSAFPAGIAAGPDGNLWFAELGGVVSGGGVQGSGQLGRITTSGTITEFPVPAGGNPVFVATGADGNVWFTDMGTNSIGRVNLKAPPSSGTDGGISSGIGGAGGMAPTNGLGGAGGRTSGVGSGTAGSGAGASGPSDASAPATGLGGMGGRTSGGTGSGTGGTGGGLMTAGLDAGLPAAPAAFVTPSAAVTPRYVSTTKTGHAPSPRLVATFRIDR